MVWTAGLVASLVVAHAHAQGYPARAVRILSQAPVGGPTDIITRGAAQTLQERLGQPFVIENRSGANGILGAEGCAKSVGDGYTVCALNGQAVSQNPVMYAKLPYDPTKDFVPVVHLGSLRSALVVHPSVSATTVAQLFEQAKAKPGSLVWASYGPASNSHLYMEWLKSTRGLQFLNVPYKTAGQAFTSMMSGEAQIAMYNAGASSAMAKGGKLRVLGVIGEEPSVFLPGVPSFKDAGIPLQIGNWSGFFVPAATPRAIVQQLNAEVSKMMAEPAFREKFMTAAGLEPERPAGRPVEEFAAFLKADRAAAEELARVVKIQPE
jgi:tripartite-type tricarboxylate transporter receptor subunit TctC